MAANRFVRFVTIAAIAAAPARAIAQQNNAIMPGLTLQPRKPVAKPFLFHVPAPAPTAPAKQPESTTAVICGMTIIHPDPAIDPGSVKTPPDTKTTFTLKIVRPTVCAAR